MTTAQEILKMIEEVSPNDTAKLDEIDARVWCWLNSKTYLGTRIVTVEDRMFRYVEHQYEDGYINSPQYTRSRDALKAIRPEGWDFIDVSGGFNHNAWTCQINMGAFTTIKCTIPTEELAELHAILQAIDYERSREA